MSAIQQLLTDHIDIWTAADTEKKSGRGRSSGSAGSVYGVKKLRELILELAVRGKLVPQDESDEPASLLLKRIAAEKAKLIAEGKIKKSKPLAEIMDDEKPFDLPEGWEWARLQSVIDVRDGTHDSPKEAIGANTFPLVTSKDFADGDINFDSAKRISEVDHIEISKRSLVEKYDILFSMIGGNIGNQVIVLDDRSFSIKNVALFKYYNRTLTFPFFIKKYTENLAVTLQTTAIGGAQPFVALGALRNLVIALPPIEEQHRIVAKVDELMALCDQLENQHNNAAVAHEKLVTHLLGTLTQPQATNTDSPLCKRGAGGDFNWQRISEHFDTLFTTESSIDALKQTLLQLAVMGKLVPQDPNDEPASELLKRILKERDRLVEHEGSRTIASDKINESEMYITSPDSWVYCRLGNIARFIDYRGKTPSKISSGVPLITAKNVRFGYISREPEEYVSPTEYESWMTRGFPRVGDMLFTTEAPLGNIAIINIDEKFALAQRVICFKLHDQAIGAYLKIAIMSNQVQQQLINVATGMTATGIKASKLKEIPVPIPTLAEQHRIVAKVDELMAICDQLKSRLTEANQLQQKLADVVIEQAIL